jgi:hypothetical protein
MPGSAGTFPLQSFDSGALPVIAHLGRSATPRNTMITTIHTMKTKLAVSLLGGVLFAFPSHAQLEIFFAQDVSPLSPGQEPFVRPPFTNSLVACTNFLSRLTKASTESFESYSPGTPPSALNFCGFTPSMLHSGTNRITSYPDPTAPSDGGYPISGTNAFVLYAGEISGPTSASCMISFSNSISAFGFFAIDVELNRLEVVIEGLPIV